MATTYIISSKLASLLSVIIVLLLVTHCASDIAQDRTECANQLVGLATCLPYVGGEAKAPTQDCCTGLKQVLKTSRKCVCILVKDRNDPSLGLKINATLALSLPQICHSPANVNDCPALLHLAPHSPDAKVFDDFAKALPNATAPASSAKPAGDGGGGGGAVSAKETSASSAEGKRQLIAQMFYGVLFLSILLQLVF